ncbi:PA2169 family four-helix-bundle protein [Chryseobacterium indologenes]|uniref:PA2169 family four-helix-bundle protein n=1 Tax=Chryseobacterium oryzae TaxID=2929799 RepID=A0ABY4BEJ3_9FLAO|nr:MULTISPECIES: PA2169 family four-helix-bundle protein [Chryseobacterium]AYZ35171.1 PA2169 family four-helix-bundle protein [Chryseobacterium indologenes]MEB4762895.1 PA2169 family four-helix-bundle protein [Chryseobacterium indologenes]UEQ78082.1 PA2169 family four-helix-bundle protein [Chryseobacterium arthrosphaerae]UOE37485.1 PA2169 family four-helix-bundle protein [Chryseobacterium oryzae]
MNHDACVEALNDLIKINNDRIEGYAKAIDELQDGENSDLKSLFSEMISESGKYKSELQSKVVAYGGSTDEGTTTSGKLYRAWMDVRAAFSGGDRASVLSNCEAGEDAAQKAYKSAIEDEDVMEETKVLLREQKQSLRVSHDKIKALRDEAKA